MKPRIESTVRAVRTAVHVLIALAAAAPLALAGLHLPPGRFAQLAAVVLAASAAVTKVWVAVETRLPGVAGWLLGTPAAAEQTAPTDDPSAEDTAAFRG